MSTPLAVILFASILAAFAADHYWFEGHGALAAGRAGLEAIRWLAFWR
ncbi:hypothetical protein FHS00_002136 [Limimaricola variabilis]|jgi:hypothetical protein|uniref:Glyceraldehyde-3-phosphate dehydrogenase n=1 Tax=Limimaricola variabilis TaxID=1492771 RepID=A0ABR6HPS6_9RHOB|nr:hypothetical protein [Limimaricola variabilis]MBB3712548.1 hypothetical protein [Limimaricola variabilis]WPY94759.1 hypothetical protein T8T21_01135 [Limimaricola variabilis]